MCAGDALPGLLQVSGRNTHAHTAKRTGTPGLGFKARTHPGPQERCSPCPIISPFWVSPAVL